MEPSRPGPDLMRPIRYFVSSVAEGWDVLSPRDAPKRYPSRSSAVEAAKDAAQEMWSVHRAASEVLINEEDGAWHLVAAYGQLLDF